MESRHESRPDAALLADRRDPEAAFAVFYRRYVGDVLAYVRSKGLDPHASADVVSATFFSALRARKSYSADRETALPWLLTIASRQIIDAARGARRYERLTRRIAQLGLRDLTAADVDGFSQALETEQRASDALRRLPPDQRVAVTRKIVAGADYADLAEELGVTPAAARQRVSRALRVLRSQLTTDDEEHRDV